MPWHTAKQLRGRLLAADLYTLEDHFAATGTSAPVAASGAVRAARSSRDGAGEATTIASIPLLMQVSRRSTVPLVQLERPVDGVSDSVPTVMGGVLLRG
jgi:hypothetical protein